MPAARLTEGIAISHTGLAAGLAPGAALAGLVIDAHGASPSYLVALGGGVVAALASLALPRSFDPAGPPGRRRARRGRRAVGLLGHVRHATAAS